MTKNVVSILCIITLVTPCVMAFAQDEASPENKPEEPKVFDTAPIEGTITGTSEVDSVRSMEVLPESLAIVPSVQPIIPPYVDEPIEEYEFKGTGRDMVIGAAVLTGWILVAFLAANQRSD
jgi:hypothetical protein